MLVPKSWGTPRRQIIGEKIHFNTSRHGHHWMTGDTPMTLETFSNPQLWNKISGHLEIHEIMEETSSNSKFGKDLRTSAFLGGLLYWPCTWFAYRKYEIYIVSIGIGIDLMYRLI